MCNEAGSLVECRNITKKYGNKVALYDFSVSIGRGRIIGLLGSNGSGKTTFIKLLAGLLTPMFGEITIDGKPVGKETKKIVSYLPERTYLNPDLTVKEAIGFFPIFTEIFLLKRQRKWSQTLA